MKKEAVENENILHHHQGTSTTTAISSRHLVEKETVENENIFQRKDGQVKKKQMCIIYRACKELRSSWPLTTMESLVFLQLLSSSSFSILVTSAPNRFFLALGVSHFRSLPAVSLRSFHSLAKITSIFGPASFSACSLCLLLIRIWKRY